MILTQKQMAALWVVQGGNPDKAWEWSAIAMGESHGDTNAHEGGDPNSCCHGYAQLNVEVGNASMGCALNPFCATKKSIELSRNGRDFTPWGAYTNGSYQTYLAMPAGFSLGGLLEEAAKTVSPLYRLFKGEAPLPHFPGQDKATGAAGDILETDAKFLGLGDLVTGVNAIGGFFKGLGELVLTPEGWVRTAKLAGGSIFVVWGLHILVRESTGTDVVKGAKKAGEAAVVAATIK